MVTKKEVFFTIIVGKNWNKNHRRHNLKKVQREINLLDFLVIHFNDRLNNKHKLEPLITAMW